jgi:hypothetical protein
MHAIEEDGDTTAEEDETVDWVGEAEGVYDERAFKAVVSTLSPISLCITSLVPNYTHPMITFLTA